MSVEHKVTFEMDASAILKHGGAEQHRWSCSCGKHGSWKRNKQDAQMGGQFHVQRTKI